MKKQFASEKGITLVTLVTALVILIIMSSMLTYNTLNGIKIKSYNNMCNDIENLDDKISAYYANYGAIPASVIFCNKTQLQSIIGFENINVNDNDVYYVIDISALENLTLVFGKQFDTSKISYDFINECDVYIINEQSHQIYYPEGITYENITYYTNGEVDKTEVVMK